MPLIDVKAAAERDNFAATQISNYDGALVPGDRHLRKARDVDEGYPHCIVDLSGEPSEAGSQHDSDRRVSGAGALTDRSCRLASRFGRVFGAHLSGSISWSIVSETSSISIRRSSHGRNALSKPLSAIPASSSTVKPRC